MPRTQGRVIENLKAFSIVELDYFSNEDALQVFENGVSFVFRQTIQPTVSEHIEHRPDVST